MNSPLKYIVVEGSIGVGKTTLAKRLAKHFGSDLILEGAAENPFLPQFYENPAGAALAAQLFFLFQRIEQIKSMSQGDMFNPVRVADFMLEKDRLFAELTLTEDELKLYDRVYTEMAVDAPIPDLVIYLQAPIEILLARIKKRGIDHEQGMDADYLQRLSETYVRFFYHYKKAPLLIINTTEVNFAEGEEDFAMLLS
ncbi:MAG: deoxynucleoside kinase, partial [Gammaproteobacteria bacterium]